MANKKVNQLTSKPAVNLTDLFLIADPTSGQAYKTTISDLGTAIGSGVSSVNSLVGAVVLDTDDIQELVSPTNKWFTDTRARAALSASSPLTYNSGTGAFGIQVANGSQNGYLSSTDWTTFNAKQAALSGTGFVKISGTTISYDNSTYLTTSSAASTYLALAGGTLTGALNGTSATFTGDLTISSTNPRIYLTDTDNNPDYFISNTDGTFTVYDVTNSTSRFTIGTTGNATFTNAITGGGSITGQSLYSNGIISAGTSLSVGTFVSAGGSLTGSALYVTGMTAGSGAIYHTGSRLTFANYNTSGTLHFEVNGGTGALTLNADKSASFEAGGSFAGALSGTSATFSGNLGAGVSSFASWAGGTENVLQVKSASIYEYGGYETALSVNAYYNAGWKYIGTNVATQFQVSNGAFTFNRSVSGTAGNAISWTPSMTINSSGNVGIGNTGESASRLYVTGADSGSSNYTLTLRNSGGAELLQARNDGVIYLKGNVGIGTYSPNSSLAISISAFSNAGLKSYTTDNVGGISAYVNNQDPYTGYLDIYATRSGDGGTLGGSEIRFLNQTTSATASAIERMRIRKSGVVSIGAVSGTSGLLDIKPGAATSDGVTLSATYTGSGSYGPFIFHTSDTERMRITAAGQLEFKGTSTNSLAQGVFENTNSNFAMYATAGGGTTKDLFFASGGSGGAPNMTFKAGGNLLIATTSDVGGKLQVNGDIRAYGSFFRETGNITVNNSWTNVFTINTASQRTYLLQIIATNSEASLSYRYFGVIQGNPASSSYTAVSLASQTMEVQFSGATIQTRLTNSNQFNFNWSITQLL